MEYRLDSFREGEVRRVPDLYYRRFYRNLRTDVVLSLADVIGVSLLLFYAFREDLMNE